MVPNCHLGTKPTGILQKEYINLYFSPQCRTGPIRIPLALQSFIGASLYPQETVSYVKDLYVTGHNLSA